MTTTATSSTEGAETMPDHLVRFSPLVWLRTRGTSPMYTSWLAERRDWLDQHPDVTEADIAAERQRRPVTY